MSSNLNKRRAGKERDKRREGGEGGVLSPALAIIYDKGRVMEAQKLL